MVFMTEKNWKADIYRQEDNTSWTKECKEGNFILKVFIFLFPNK